MERITSRDSVSVCAKKEYQTVRHTQNPYRFSIWTGTRELNIMCASLYKPYTSITVQCTMFLYILHMHEHITNGKIFFASAHHIHSPTERSHSSFPFSECKCLLLVVTTDWVIRVCIGVATGLKNDWQLKRNAQICGEQAAIDSHCSDIKRENCETSTLRKPESEMNG